MTHNSNPTTANATQRPLSGLKVLDMTQFLSGPFGSMVLGDLGAEVIKIEPRSGELSRSIPPHFIADDSVYYLSVNRNKKNMVVDLKKQEGIEVVKNLVASCDIVIENFRPGVLERLGISYTKLSELKPSIIWCSVTGFGQDGPWRDWPAYDMMIQALSGGMSLTGPTEGPSVRAGIPLGDISAGLYGVIGILAALHERNLTGKGKHIDIAMMDCQVAMLSYQAAYYLHSGQVPGRQGTGHDSFPTYGTFPTKDGKSIVVTANTEKMWKEMANCLGLTSLISDPRFITNKERLSNRAVIEPLLQQAFLARNAQEWMDDFLALGIPAGVVNTLDITLNGPQIQHRQMVVELKDEMGHSVKVVASPIKFNEELSTRTDYPARLGQHTDSVLKDILGYTDEQIATLNESGAVYQSD